MQGQYGSADDRKLGKVASDLWREHGFRNGIMRGFWVTVAREIPAYAGQYISTLGIKAGYDVATGFYACYEFTKRSLQARLTPNSPGTQLPVWALLTAGGAGGIGYVRNSLPVLVSSLSWLSVDRLLSTRCAQVQSPNGRPTTQEYCICLAWFQ